PPPERVPRRRRRRRPRPLVRRLRRVVDHRQERLHEFPRRRVVDAVTAFHELPYLNRRQALLHVPNAVRSVPIRHRASKRRGPRDPEVDRERQCFVRSEGVPIASRSIAGQHVRARELLRLRVHVAPVAAAGDGPDPRPEPALDAVGLVVLLEGRDRVLFTRKFPIKFFDLLGLLGPPAPLLAVPAVHVLDDDRREAVGCFPRGNRRHGHGHAAAHAVAHEDPRSLNAVLDLDGVDHVPRQRLRGKARRITERALAVAALVERQRGQARLVQLRQYLVPRLLAAVEAVYQYSGGRVPAAYARGERHALIAAQRERARLLSEQRCCRRPSSKLPQSWAGHGDECYEIANESADEELAHVFLYSTARIWRTSRSELCP
ncbi:unnamed protein product, partial [Pelagomonas calceolata]